MAAEDLGRISAILNNFWNELHSRALLNRLGLAGIRLIKVRTRSGKFLPGSSSGGADYPYTRYSERHAERRARAGLPTHVVNLEFDDIAGMLQNVDHIVAADLNSVSIDIIEEEKKRIAGYHHETGAGKSRVIRKWFDLSSEEQEEIAEIVEEAAKLAIAKLK